MAALWLLACGSEPETSGSEEEPPAEPPDAAADFQGRTYERMIVFISTAPDFDLILPWSFQARTLPDGVERQSRGWLARDEAWDPFYAVTWSTPPSRAPWRILPHPPLRLLVGQEDALERLVYEEEGRSVELAIGDALVDWSGQRGETFRIHEAQAFFPTREVSGLLMDMARARESGAPPPGDWAFLLSGDSVQLVFEDSGGEDEPSAASEEAHGAYQAWARLDFRDTQWPDVSLSWAETRSYEEARREVPVAWNLTTGDGELEGALEVQGAWLETRQGQGPLLPVQALFEVRGEISIQGRQYPVHGLFRHVQR